MADQHNELNAHEKAVIAFDALVKSDGLTTGEIAGLTGISWQGADKMMDSISRVLPVTKHDSRWKLFNHT